MTSVGSRTIVQKDKRRFGLGRKPTEADVTDSREGRRDTAKADKRQSEQDNGLAWERGKGTAWIPRGDDQL